MKKLLGYIVTLILILSSYPLLAQQDTTKVEVTIQLIDSIANKLVIAKQQAKQLAIQDSIIAVQAQRDTAQTVALDLLRASNHDLVTAVSTEEQAVEEQKQEIKGLQHKVKEVAISWGGVGLILGVILTLLIL